jgi:alpha-1,6-mannosyltransferase
VTPIASETQTTSDSPAEPAPTWRARLRLLLQGPPDLPAEEITPYTPPTLPDPHWLGPVRRNVMLIASALSGFLGSLLIVVTAPVWYMARGGSWRLTIPGVPHPGTSSLFAGTTFVLGVILMTLGWIGLIGRAERQRGSERRRLLMVVSVLTLWVVPLLLAPPLLSNDAYSYVAQGELASRGIDPTSHGPVYLLQDDNLMSPADPVWRNSPAPYGPVWIGLSRAVLEATGHDSANSLWGFRGLAVVGVAMSAVGIAIIARSYRLSPASAIALGIANPLVLLHLIGGSHNDALMLGFLALGLAAFRRDKRVLTVVLVALAVAVKLPAAVALIYIGWAWAGKGAPLRARIMSIARTLGGAVAIVAALCLLVGIGAGWLVALQGTNSITSTFSTTTKLGYVLSDTINLTGLGINENLVVGAFRLLGLAAAGLVGLALLFRSDRLGVVRCVGLALVAVIILGPVVWPWYLPAGFAILAAAGLGKWRPSYYVVSFAACLLVFPRSVNAVPSLSRWQHFLGLGVVCLIGAAAYLAPKFAEWTRARRSDRLGLDDSDGIDGANHQPAQHIAPARTVVTADV